LQQTILELCIRPITLVGLIFFYPFFTYYFFNFIYRRKERDGFDDNL